MNIFPDQKMKNNYDSIAYNYDWLSKLVFGKALILSQTCLLKHIPAGSKVLIAGGGTGWILNESAKIHESGLTITYVEISEKMIVLAKRQDAKSNKVIFVNKAIEDYISNEKYDIIFTAFLFDNFRFEKIETVFRVLKNLLERDGKWLFADFSLDEKSKPWQKLLLKAMLFFFRIICNIEARKLIAVDEIFEKNGFEKSVTYSHYRGFIKSSVYDRI